MTKAEKAMSSAGGGPYARKMTANQDVAANVMNEAMRLTMANAWSKIVML